MLLKQRAVATLHQPREYDLKVLREWLERPSMGAMPLLGLDRNSWDSLNENDLLSLHPRTPTDSFSVWVSETLVPIYHRFLGQRTKVRFFDFMKYINKYANSALLPWIRNLLTRSWDKASSTTKRLS